MRTILVFAVIVVFSLAQIVLWYGKGWDDGIARVCPLPAADEVTK